MGSPAAPLPAGAANGQRGEASMSELRELAVVVGATGVFGTAIVERLCASGLGVLAVARSAASRCACCSPGG